MPPRGRGRGRGGGRWATRGSTRGGGRVAKSAPRLNRTRRNSFGTINGNLSDQTDGAGVHAIFEPPGLLIIAGLLPEHFPDYDSDQGHNDSDSHSDYGSATAKTPRKLTAKERLQEIEHASNPGNDDDWTETEVEVIVAPKTRGFYRPPPKREVVRKRVKRVESSRYNDTVPKIRHSGLSEDIEYDDTPSRRSSQKSSHENADLPIIVEQEATDDEVEGEGAGEGDGDDRPVPTRQTSSESKKSKKETKSDPGKSRLQIIDEGELSDSNFPPAYLKRPPTPPEEKCDDRADWIMQKRFAPMGDPQSFIAALTKLDPSTRSTEVLFELALNAQRAIKAWQDEYLELDLVTAPKANPPKKPLLGGRATIDPEIYDDMLEADLYGYTYDAKKGPGMQDPFRQRAGGGKFVGGRELRQRRGRDVGAIDLSEPEGTDNGGYGTRRRRAAQRQSNQLEVPPRGVKRTNSTGTSDYDAPPRKRGRPSAADRNLMQTRVRQLREESAARSTSSERDGAASEPPRRRGRPPGSKNTMPRSDAGIKKGPRKPRFTSVQVESENASLDPPENATPVSGEDVVMVDEAASTTGFNGVTGHANAKLELRTTNGEPTAPSMERTSTSASTPGPDGPPLKDKDPKKRVRSEKRSKSMTEWWAARKAKAAEDRKLQLAAQAEQDRIAEEQARAAHAAHQAQFPPQDARYWPQIAPQHPPQHHPQHPPQQQPQNYGGPPPQAPPPTFVSGPPPQGPPPQGPPQHGSPPPAPQPQPHSQPPPPPPHHPSHHPPAPQFHSQVHHAPNTRPEPQHIPPPLPAGHPQGLPAQGPPPPPQQQQGPPQHHPHHGPPPEQQQIPVQSHAQSSSHGSPSGHSVGLPPILHPNQSPHRQRSVSFAGPPAQPPLQHVFHNHPAPPPPPPPGPAQYSPSSLPQAPNRQASPLRRIINYVSDPSKAAQPAGPPYQTIMTPGASSPTIIHHQGHPTRPDSRGRTPPSNAGGFMSAFHINNHTSRAPIPGTGSFRPDTPGKSTFTNYTAPPAPRTQGRMTGAQVQDLALAAVQPMQRKPLEDVLKEQREWRTREPSPPPPQSGPRPLFKLQPAPLVGPNGPHQPQLAAPNSDGPPPPPTLPGLHQHHQQHERGPSLPPYKPQQPPPVLFASRPASSSGRRPSLGPSLAALANQNSHLHHVSPVPLAPSPAGTQRHQLPPLMSVQELERLEDKSAAPSPYSGSGGAGRHRSISTSSQGPPPIRFPDLHRDVGRGSSTTGSVPPSYPPDSH